MRGANIIVYFQLEGYRDVVTEDIAIIQGVMLG